MKKKSQKGFTLVEVIAVIAILGILGTVAIMAVTKYITKSRNAVYHNYEKNMEVAAASYLTNNMGDLPTSSGDSLRLESSKLLTGNYIDDMPDPADKNKKCTGYVTVVKNNNTSTNTGNDEDYTVNEDGSITWKDGNTTNLDLKYKVCLICSKYKTEGCGEGVTPQTLKKVIVTFDVNTGNRWTSSTCSTNDLKFEDVSCSKEIELSSDSVRYGTLPTPTKNGYTFKGWFTDDEGGSQISTTTKITTDQNHTLYAHWELKRYTIRYNKNNTRATGSMSDQVFTYGVAQALTANGFSLDGYTFAGWSTKADGSGTRYNDQQEGINLTNNMTLYAQWIKNSSNKYTVKFNKNNSQATGSMTDQIIESGVATNLTANSFSLTGYDFNKWTTNSDGSGTSYTDRQKVTDLAQSDGSATLYAQWTAKKYNVTYSGNGGTYNNSTTFSEQATYNSNYTVRSNNNLFVRTGYEFVGWKDGNGNTWEPGSVNKWTNTKDVILYAQWRAHTITFKIKLNSTDSVSSTTTSTTGVTYTWGKNSSNLLLKDSQVYESTINYESTTLDLPDYHNSNFINISRGGYQAVSGSEWKCTNCATSNYLLSQSSHTLTTTERNKICNIASSDCTVELVVNWRPNIFKFNIKLNSSDTITARTFGSSDGSVTYNWTKNASGLLTLNGSVYAYSKNYDDTTMNLPDYDYENFINITRTGHQAVSGKEWKCNNCTDTNLTMSDSDGTVIDHEFMQKVCNILEGDCTRNISVNWEAKKYTVTYDGNGGKISSTGAVAFGETATYGSSYTIASNKFTRDGYTFTGWNDKADGSGTSFIAGNGINWVYATTKTLYAQWRANKISFRVKVRSDETYKTPTKSSDGATTYTWSLNNTTDRLLKRDGSIYENVVKYDSSTMNLPDPDYANYISISKNGYIPKSGAEWICLSGCKTSGQTFKDTEHAITNSTLANYCNIKTGDCTIVLGVNWTEDSYNLDFDKNSGSGTCSTITKKYNVAWGDLCEVTRSGYDFVNWRDKSSTTDVIKSTTKATKDTTAIANWAYCDPDPGLGWRNDYGRIKIYSTYSKTSYYAKDTNLTSAGTPNWTSVTTNTSWTSGNFQHYKFKYYSEGSSNYYSCYTKFDNLKPYTPYLTVTSYSNSYGSYTINCDTNSKTTTGDRYCKIIIPTDSRAVATTTASGTAREYTTWSLETSYSTNGDQSSTSTSGSSGIDSWNDWFGNNVEGPSHGCTWRSSTAYVTDNAGNKSGTLYVALCFNNNSNCYPYTQKWTGCKSSN